MPDTHGHKHTWIHTHGHTQGYIHTRRHTRIHTHGHTHTHGCACTNIHPRPRGSVPDPFLFSTYTYYFNDLTQSNGFKYHLYGKGSQVYIFKFKSFTSTNLSKPSTRFQPILFCECECQKKQNHCGWLCIVGIAPSLKIPFYSESKPVFTMACKAPYYVSSLTSSPTNLSLCYSSHTGLLASLLFFEHVTPAFRAFILAAPSGWTLLTQRSICLTTSLFQAHHPPWLPYLKLQTLCNFKIVPHSQFS